MTLSPALDRVFSLAGRTTLVTGAASGLGLAIAKGFAEAGATVALADLNEAGAAQVAAQIRQAGREAFSLWVDVTDRDSVNQAVQNVLGQAQTIDVLVNCAGINIWGSAVDLDATIWGRILDVNLTGTFHCCQAVGAYMLKKGTGTIVNMASIAGMVAVPGVLAYAVSKAGVIQLTRMLAVEWAPVRVNALAPSTFETPLVERNRAQRPQVYAELLQKIPLGRFGKPEELVGSALFLASDASGLITGHTLVVDGGYLAQ